MRIDAIRITGLASLRDQQPEIALSGPLLRDAGLIAITGPTGAGKSTILDAVCLALYGDTPRLVRGKEKASELLSRGAGAGQAEVDITLDDGRRWRATWSVVTAKRKAGGKVQQAQMSLLDLEGNQALAEGVGACRARIKDALGLDFEHFTSVILLAQGQFATFLNAKDSERAEILERLTGTEQYARLGKLAWDEAKAAEGAVSAQEQAIAAVAVMDAETRAAVVADAAGGAERVAAATAAAKRAADIAAWWDREAQMAAAVVVADEVLKKARAMHAAAEAERGRLSLARAAQELAPQVTGLDVTEARLRTAVAAAAAAAKALEKETASARVLRGELGQALAAMDAAARQAGERVGRLAAMAAAVPARTAAARAACERVTTARQGHARALAALAEQQRLAGELTKKALAAMKLGEDTKRVAGEAAARAALALAEAERAAGAEGIPGLVARSERLAACRVLWRDYRGIDRSGAGERAVEAERVAAEKKTAAVVAEEAATALGTRVSEESRLLQMATVGASAAGMRHVLVDGKPCPLCGAVEHPWAAGEAPDADETLKNAGERLKARDGEWAVARKTAEQARAVALEAATAVATARAKEAAAVADVVRLESAWSAARAAVASMATELAAGIADQDGTAMDAVVARAQAAVGAASAAADTAFRLRTAAEKLAVPAQAAAVAAGAALSAASAAEAAVVARGAEVEAEAGRVQEAEEVSAGLVAVLAAACALSAPVDGVAAWLEKLAFQHEEWKAATEDMRLAEAAGSELAEPARAMVGAESGCVPAVKTGGAQTVGAARAGLARALERARAVDAAVRRSGDAAETAKQAVAEAEESRGAAVKSLTDALVGGPFADRAALAAATMAPAGISVLAERLAKIDQALHAAVVRGDDAAAAIKRHHETALAEKTDRQSGDVATARAAAGVAQDELMRVVGAAAGARERLQTDDQQGVRRDALGVELERLQATSRRAAALRETIGSADGDAFRRFAQTLTLDQLLALANRRLERFAPRYRLVRAVAEDARPSLDLAVVDLDLAGERRPIATLSGGETFLVSLALALALADLRRGNRPLGTLFLDEGFGTLDAESLDGAIATLEEIQAAQGTQILIISHVGGLKDRLACIVVRKRGGGCSELSVELPTGAARAPARKPGAASGMGAVAAIAKPAPRKAPTAPKTPHEAANVDGAGRQEKLF